MFGSPAVLGTMMGKAGKPPATIGYQAFHARPLLIFACWAGDRGVSDSAGARHFCNLRARSQAKHAFPSPIRQADANSDLAYI